MIQNVKDVTQRRGRKVQFSEKDMIAFVSRTASSQFARGVVKEIGELLQTVKDNPQAPTQYVQGYGDAVSDVQRALTQFADLMDEKIANAKKPK